MKYEVDIKVIFSDNSSFIATFLLPEKAQERLPKDATNITMHMGKGELTFIHNGQLQTLQTIKLEGGMDHGIII